MFMFIVMILFVITIQLGLTLRVTLIPYHLGLFFTHFFFLSVSPLPLPKYRSIVIAWSGTVELPEQVVNVS